MKNNKVVVVLPAYNAEKTLQKTINAIPENYADEIILVDDVSKDNTVKLAKKIKLKVFVHDKNLGYGGNQKTCYEQALKAGADIVVMVHPDYQYSPELVAPMVEMIKTGLYDCVLGSRILSGDSLRAGMPLYKYIGNRFLTMVENIVLGQNLSEYHKKPIIKEGKYWILTDNQWPYKKIKHQVLAIYKNHIEHIEEIDPEAGKELIGLFQEESKKSRRS